MIDFHFHQKLTIIICFFSLVRRPIKYFSFIQSNFDLCSVCIGSFHFLASSDQHVSLRLLSHVFQAVNDSFIVITCIQTLVPIAHVMYSDKHYKDDIDFHRELCIYTRAEQSNSNRELLIYQGLLRTHLMVPLARKDPFESDLIGLSFLHPINSTTKVVSGRTGRHRRVFVRRTYSTLCIQSLFLADFGRNCHMGYAIF